MEYYFCSLNCCSHQQDQVLQQMNPQYRHHDPSLPCRVRSSHRSLGSRPKQPKWTPTKCRTKLSVDPQSVAARHRRHRISKRFKILQGLVPGGSKMDTASMLDGAIRYVKYLKAQIWLHHFMESVGSVLGEEMGSSLGSGVGLSGLVRGADV
ncbi:hypothetical protein AMTRI_Chr01g133040 [Amborella trichopoda]|uniref:BHLH domain-containing protein n=1 Tax=Amborella trichopoda TaxID=13333 RepID=W1Q0C6_AMBTC|nr:transcription factor HEC2 [Amborella trichopoda]ERN13959.1 hypothetical protein AMTR_s00021p00146370 [Amborella trichopoda]|eukprot:XP_006852492.1 transcription factor HEC2 [Amborella trichopoda]